LGDSSGSIPFVNVVGAGYDGFYDDNPMDPEAHYKIPIELLGHFSPAEVGSVSTLIGDEKFHSPVTEYDSLREELLKSKI
jgi:hypothetical protein